MTRRALVLVATGMAVVSFAPSTALADASDNAELLGSFPPV